MRCKKVLFHLSAYADHELSGNLSREIEDHLQDCGGCRIAFEQIQQVDGFLSALDALPVPLEFADRVMSEARKRILPVAEKKSFLAWDRFSLQLLLELSMPVRLAACTAVLLAFFLGMTMSREISLSGSRQAAASREAGMEGFEWFSPAPPESLEHTYMILASSFDVGGNPR
ncbi:MAG: zf-HC2 domain-containing protein [Deltaproteobacteria bacterium]|nr:zf-HC2 domain-containing protein [Deltaproteobacteria bacterium]